VAAEHGRELAGGFLCLRHGSVLYLWAAGLDYATLPELHTYGWLLAESVAHAAATGAAVVDAGRGNYLVKRRLGFTQVPLYSVCYLASPCPGLAASLAEMSHRITAGSPQQPAGVGTGTGRVVTRWRARTLGGLPAMFWRAAAVVAVGRSGVYVQLFLGYYLARSLSLSSSQVAVVLAAWGAGWAAGTPLGGRLADHIGARAVIIIGNTTAAAAYVSAGMARSFPVLVGTAGLVGLVQDAWRPAAMAVIASAAPGETQRKRCLTLTWWLVQVTGVFAALTGGVIGARIGLGWLFPANAATALGAAVAARMVCSPASRKQVPAPQTRCCCASRC
jgi:Major Facilitator Superfamily/Acetyltransferase (GNAT) domain